MHTVARTQRSTPTTAADKGPLGTYQRMRDFAQTPEPAGAASDASGERLSFVVQKHAARQLHYDFRLELDGTLKSWAVPKGPSLDPHDKRMAVQVEDHPLSYGSFEGTIPPKQYGAGTVIVWDNGTWAPVGDARQGLREGKLKFTLHGSKLQGNWALVRMRGRDDDAKPMWLLIKEHDAFERPASDYSVVDALPDSVLSNGDGKGKGKAAAKAVSGAPKKLNGDAAAPAAKAAAKTRGARKAKTAGASASKAYAATTGEGQVATQAAPRAKLPATLAPQLATLVQGIPGGDGWSYEIKFDGYRLLVRIDHGQVRCFTRNGHDWSDKLPHLVQACQSLSVQEAWLDGEIVVPGSTGTPDFQALQNAFDSRSTGKIEYFVFDLPYCDGKDLRGLPLVQRRARLQALLQDQGSGALHYSQDFDADPAQLLESARQSGLEGLIGKRTDSLYTSARSPNWVKLKTQQRQEFVIGGYTDPKGSRASLGALLLGVHDADGALRYAGNVGTGFDQATLSKLAALLAPLKVPKSPFADAPARVGTVQKVAPHWVKPQLVAEVSFAQWTADKRVRHAVFQGLRSDKPAQDVTSEVALSAAAVRKAAAKSAAKTPAKSAAPAAAKRATSTRGKASKVVEPTATAVAAAGTLGIRITHPERVIDTASGLTKGDLVTYYTRVAPLVLPHLQDRPLALLRAPGGIGAAAFFQKHADNKQLPHVRLLDPALDPEHPPLLAIDNVEGLVSAAQMNLVELHTWNATASRVDKPDRMVFDLDPGEGVAWAQMQEGSQLLHSLLNDLGLASFVKTSGGKGLHVVVPLQPRLGWDAVKAFSQAVVQHMSDVLPTRFVAKSGPRNRVKRIFIDYLRNGFGATTACAWSARARPGLGVSVPVTWDELPKLTGSAQWTVANAAERFDIGNMPWQVYEDARQTLTAAMKTLGFKLPRAKA